VPSGERFLIRTMPFSTVFYVTGLFIVNSFYCRSVSVVVFSYFFQWHCRCSAVHISEELT
jgi:hypothetical protein